MDVEALYTNIKHEDGLKTLEEKLNKRKTNEPPTSFITKLMEIILNENIFEFHDGLFKQNIGASMGSKPIPHYANVFMAMIDDLLKILDGAKALALVKRYLDDYFMLFNGSTKSLHALFVKINSIHPTIKMSMSHTSIKNEAFEDKCECEEKCSIPFMDVMCSISEGKIETDLFRKSTDRNQYLLPSSCHSKSTTKAIPFSLGLRIVRACSDPRTRDMRLLQLRDQLLARDYSRDLVETALERARNISRDRALKKAKNKRANQRPVLVVPYDPRLPAIGSIMAKHYRAMTKQDSYLKQVFKDPPLTAFRRQLNLRNHLIRARVPQKERNHPKRFINGMSKCGDQCTACPYVKEGKKIRINGQTWNINRQVNCKSYNLVYAIYCIKENCRQVYIGETKRMLKSRVADHRGYVTNKVTSQATGEHFNLPGHSLADLRVSVIEQTARKGSEYRKEREHYHIRKFNTFHNGINKQK